MTAEELLERYAAGERDFQMVDLSVEPLHPILIPEARLINPYTVPDSRS